MKYVSLNRKQTGKKLVLGIIGTKIMNIPNMSIEIQGRMSRKEPFNSPGCSTQPRDAVALQRITLVNVKVW